MGDGEAIFVEGLLAAITEAELKNVREHAETIGRKIGSEDGISQAILLIESR